jgi:hypothetical protein
MLTRNGIAVGSMTKYEKRHPDEKKVAKGMNSKSIRFSWEIIRA